MPKTSPADDRRKPRTDSIEIYPAGRGKIISIVKKSIPPKPRKKHDPRFVHFWLPSNPDNIAMIEYLDPKKRIYLFPEGRRLEREDRLKMAASLVLSIRSLDRAETWNYRRNAPYFITRELREEINRQWKRYTKWRTKQK